MAVLFLKNQNRLLIQEKKVKSLLDMILIESGCLAKSIIVTSNAYSDPIVTLKISGIVAVKKNKVNFFKYSLC